MKYLIALVVYTVILASAIEYHAGLAALIIALSLAYAVNSD